MRFSLVLFAALLRLPAQTMVAPLAGTMVDAHGRIALLHGVMGNLLVPQYTARPPELLGQTILSSAFHTNSGVLKTENRVILLDDQGAVQSVQPAPPGQALFSFSTDGSPAWIFYPADGELWNVNTGASINGFGDAVVALGTAAAASIPVLTVNSQQQLWSGVIAVPGGALQEQTPVSGAAPCVFFQNGWLTSSATGLFWTPLASGAAGFAIALPEPVQTLQMSSAGAVVVNHQWLLNARFQLLEIPSGASPPRKANGGNPPGKAQ